MATISRSHGYLFIESPRTGCTALSRGVLLPHLQGESLPPENMCDEKGRVLFSAKHASLRDLVDHNLLTKTEASSLFKFTTVRNPFDSVVSDYVKRAKELHTQLDDKDSWIHRSPKTVRDMEFARSHSFPEWVEHRFTQRSGALRQRRPVSGRHITGAQLEGVDHVMRFESLQSEFAHVLELLGIEEHHEIPSIHVTKSREGQGYREFYDTRSREVIEHVHRPDLERFGYSF